jgi:hypothetical protein
MRKLNLTYEQTGEVKHFLVEDDDFELAKNILTKGDISLALLNQGNSARVIREICEFVITNDPKVEYDGIIESKDKKNRPIFETTATTNNYTSAAWIPNAWWNIESFYSDTDKAMQKIWGASYKKGFKK